MSLRYAARYATLVVATASSLADASATPANVARLETLPSLLAVERCSLAYVAPDNVVELATSTNCARASTTLASSYVPAPVAMRSSRRSLTVAACLPGLRYAHQAASVVLRRSSVMSSSRGALRSAAASRQIAHGELAHTTHYRSAALRSTALR